jgi:predicted AAA+ superfamily ATPase
MIDYDKLYPYQQKIIEAYNEIKEGKRVLLIQPRRAGKSWAKKILQDIEKGLKND